MLSNETIFSAIDHAIDQTNFSFGQKLSGKVRDIYLQGERRTLVASDRLSSFDRIITTIPYKGQVLNQLAAWWFDQTKDVIQNHVIDIPDPQIMVCREAQALPVEVVVRGFITGVTDTSLWTLYRDGVDKPYGLELPEGLQKNQRLPEPVITPTTKGGPGEHDEGLSSAEVVSKGLVEEKLWKKVCDVALSLFRRGQELAAKQGMLLVDTKYEFGLIDGELVVIDEVHTPDSSRYWYAEGYEEAFAKGEQPRSLDKEYMRRWLKEQGYHGEGEVPPVPNEVIAECAKRYIEAYEQITGQEFVPAAQPPLERMTKALEA